MAWKVTARLPKVGKSVMQWTPPEGAYASRLFKVAEKNVGLRYDLLRLGADVLAKREFAKLAKAKRNQGKASPAAPAQ